MAALGSLLVLLLAAAGSARAAAPAEVTVRVEGATKTLVAERTVTTSDTPVTRDGVSCSGTSAAGALEAATGGAWTGASDQVGGIRVTGITGEAFPNALDSRTYVLMVNSVVWRDSPCLLELNKGDRVLFYLSRIPASNITPNCRTTGLDGICGSVDRTGPTAAITSIREQQRFKTAQAPLTLSGFVARDPNGLADVRIRLTRVAGKKCHYYSGIEETFLRLDTCGADGLQLFSIGSSARWVYVLPRRMTPGRYTLDVQAVDKLGNLSAVDARGRDRIVFYVTR